MNLTTYLSTHGAVLYLCNNAIELQAWLDSTPSHEIYFLLAAIPFNEKGKLFKIRDASAWYGTVCEKISNNTEIEVLILGINSIQRKKELQKRVDLFMDGLVSMDLMNLDMQGLLHALLSRSMDTFSILVLMLVADGVISELTLYKLQVEFSPYKRWQTLGLSEAPTIQELESYFV